MLALKRKPSGQSLDMASTAPVMNALSAKEGSYRLVNGTDGCPSSVIWIEQCAGFVLNPRKGTTELETAHFCHINAGAKVTVENNVKTYSQTEHKDRYIRKATTTVMNGVSYLDEDTLIFDSEKDQFLWEHSKEQKGFSCLYSK